MVVKGGGAANRIIGTPAFTVGATTGTAATGLAGNSELGVASAAGVSGESASRAGEKRKVVRRE